MNVVQANERVPILI